MDTTAVTLDDLSATARRLAPMLPSHTGLQRIGHLLRVGALQGTEREVARQFVSEFGRRPASHPDRASAYAFEDRAKAAGIQCYTRCWHLGEVGYFTIRMSDYSRVAPSDLEP